MKKFKYILAAAALCLILCFAACTPHEDEPPTPTTPFELTTTALETLNPDPIADNNRVFYQIFVGSFSDSNGDGVGDIRGIINRMNYLNDGDYTDGKSLGVQGIWLSPIFPSPSYHKYDATDYYSIDSKFGTLDDLKELLTICHARNVKVILDLAINHSSSQHPFFRQFCEARKNGNNTSDYYDYYTCYAKNDTSKPNNSYTSVPGASEWLYESNFSSDMPELNFDNNYVREEMLNVAKFWLNVGVDGFRFDAVKYIYYNDNAASVDFWKWYVEELKKVKPDIYLVGECWDNDATVLEYYAAMNCFDFSTSGPSGRVADAVRSENVGLYTNYVVNFINSLKKQNPDGMFMPFLSNHDMDRAVGFLTVASGNAFTAASMYILTSGSPVIYYGEEIGMKGTRGGANTDANRRLAMLWGDEDTVKNPVGATYESEKQTNGTAFTQLQGGDSLVEHYKSLIALRIKYPEIARGDYTALRTTKGAVGGFSITFNGSTIGVLHNASQETLEIKLPDGFTELKDFVGPGTASIANGMLTIGPSTSVILK